MFRIVWNGRDYVSRLYSFQVTALASECVYDTEHHQLRLHGKDVRVTCFKASSLRKAVVLKLDCEKTFSGNNTVPSSGSISFVLDGSKTVLAAEAADSIYIQAGHRL